MCEKEFVFSCFEMDRLNITGRSQVNIKAPYQRGKGLSGALWGANADKTGRGWNGWKNGNYCRAFISAGVYWNRPWNFQ